MRNGQRTVRQVEVGVDCNAGPVPMIEKAALRGRTFTAWVNYPSGAPRWPLGCRLDDGPTAGVLPLRNQQDEIVALSFPTLPTGMHRLRVGLLAPNPNIIRRQCILLSGSQATSNGGLDHRACSVSMGARRSRMGSARIARAIRIRLALGLDALVWCGSFRGRFKNSTPEIFAN